MRADAQQRQTFARIRQTALHGQRLSDRHRRGRGCKLAQRLAQRHVELNASDSSRQVAKTCLVTDAQRKTLSGPSGPRPAPQ